MIGVCSFCSPAEFPNSRSLICVRDAQASITSWVDKFAATAGLSVEDEAFQELMQRVMMAVQVQGIAASLSRNPSEWRRAFVATRYIKINRVRNEP